MELKLYSATYYGIGGGTSLDVVGISVNLGKIIIIPCMCTAYSLSLHSVYRKDNCNDESTPKTNCIKSAKFHLNMFFSASAWYSLLVLCYFLQKALPVTSLLVWCASLFPFQSLHSIML